MIRTASVPLYDFLLLLLLLSSLLLVVAVEVMVVFVMVASKGCAETRMRCWLVVGS